MTLQTYLALVQGLYFLATGLWPLFNIRTFQAVTGPKTDLWLVKTVGVLITVIGGVLVTASVRQRVDFETVLLAVASAGAMIVIDTWYALRRVVSPIYLLDAVVELVFVVLWISILTRQHIP